MPAATALTITRRHLLVGLLLVPPALGACSAVGAGNPDEPDPLIALADAARADATLAAAAVVADPALADRVRPLVDARTAHAAALDAEVVRLDPSRTGPSTSRGPAPTSSAVDTSGPGGVEGPLERIRAALSASASAAAAAALGLPAERVGLVAAVAACCGAYAAVLT